MIKQVIIIRKDLSMRKGKCVAQGAHASLQAYLKSINGTMLPHHAAAAYEWLTGLSTKICVGVDSEADLKNLHAEARLVGLPTALIQDAGLTEFKEPTYTAVAIGPADSEEIDKITGKLKLL